MAGLFVGATFSSYKELNNAVEVYSKENHLKFMKSDSKLLKSSAKFSENTVRCLVYKFIHYECKFCARVERQAKRSLDSVDHRFLLKVRVSKDHLYLEVTEIGTYSDHNHIMSEDLLLNYKRKRYKPKQIECPVFGDTEIEDTESQDQDASDVIKDDDINMNNCISTELLLQDCEPGQRDTSNLNTDSQHVDVLAKKLLTFQKEGLFCDTSIVTNDGVVFLHSAVMAAVCPNMLSVLNQKPFLNHSPNIIDLQVYSSALINKLIDFFYTGKLCQNLEMSDFTAIKDICGKLGIKLEPDNLQVVVKQEDILLEEVDPVELETLEIPNNVECLKLEDSSREVLECVDTAGAAHYVSDLNSVEFTEMAEIFEKRGRGRPRKDGGMTGCKEFPNKISSLTQTDKISKKKNLVKHVSETGEIKFGHKCQMCELIFTNYANLNAHRISHYKTETGEYQCNKCGTVFKLSMALRRHMVIHGRVVSRPYVCSLCGHKFAVKQRLEFHMNVHNGVKPFACSTCDRRFTDSDAMKKHMRRHVDDRRYLCGFCGKRFFRFENYSAHIRIHTGERPYVCSVCNRGFSQRHAMKCHLLQHTGERPFVCDQCGKGFRRVYRLKVHKLTVHTKESDKSHRCEQCPKVFGSGNALRSHILTHSVRQSTCSICRKIYVERVKRPTKGSLKLCADCS